MKAKTFLILCLVLALSVGVSIWLLEQQNADGLDSPALIADSAEVLSSLQRISVSARDGLVFTAELQDEQWQATHLNSALTFPVDTSTVAAMISQLQDANKLEAKTRKPKNFSRLGLSDLDAENARSHLIQLTTQTDDVSLLVGDNASNNMGSYVRFPDDNQTWLIDQTLDLPSDPYEWLQNPALTTELSDLQQVTWSGEQAWQAVRGTSDANPSWQLSDIQPTESLTYPSIIENSISSMLSAQYEQVLPATEVDLSFEPTAQMTWYFDDEIITVNLFQRDDKHYVTYSSTEQDWIAKWVFEVSSFTFNQLNRGRDELVETTEPEDNVKLSDN